MNLLFFFCCGEFYISHNKHKKNRAKKLIIYQTLLNISQQNSTKVNNKKLADIYLCCGWNRSYYRCTNRRCGAKKQVERSSEDPDTLVITYEGLHLHFSHPYFLSNQPQHVDPPSKKPKRTISEDEFQAHETRQPPEQGQECSTHVTSPGSLPSSSTADDYMQESDLEAMGPRGLLEDVVPFMIRNPSNYNVSSYSSSSSYRSPPTSPSSSLSWSPILSHSCFDVGLNTSIG